jgi:prepilin-type N-terminal cleavage/methylation domain-containing protein
MKKRVLTSNSGMTLIEVMIAVAISSVVILASLSVGQMSMQTQAQNNVSFQADVIRRGMIALISSDTAWKNTISGACFTAGSYCTSDTTSAGTVLGIQTVSVIKDASNNNAYNANSPNGYNNDGSPCTGSGSYTCPLTYQVTWQPLCASAATCNNPPQFKVVVKPIYTPPTASGSQKLIFNAANYGFTLYR